MTHQEKCNLALLYHSSKSRMNLSPVTGPSFFYACKNCKVTHLSREEERTREGELYNDHADLTYNNASGTCRMVHTLADLNGKPFEAYYCGPSVGLSAIAWAEMIDRSKGEGKCLKCKEEHNMKAWSDFCPRCRHENNRERSNGGN